MLGDITVGGLGRSLRRHKPTIGYIGKTVRNLQFFEKKEFFHGFSTAKYLHTLRLIDAFLLIDKDKTVS